MQLTHLGTVLNLAIAENVTISMAYDAKIRTYAHELPKFRPREKEIINLLKEEDQRHKWETVRECGTTTTFFPMVDTSEKTPWATGDRTREPNATKDEAKAMARVTEANAKEAGNPPPTGTMTTGTVVPRTTETPDLRTTQLQPTAHSRLRWRPLQTLLKPKGLRRRSRRSSDDEKQNLACQYLNTRVPSLTRIYTYPNQYPSPHPPSLGRSGKGVL